MSQVLLAERQLADGPNFGVRLQLLLDFCVEGARLQGDDFGSRIGIMGDRGATFGAEDPVDSLAGAALTSPALGGSVHGQLVLGNNGDQSCGSESNISTSSNLPTW